MRSMNSLIIFKKSQIFLSLIVITFLSTITAYSQYQYQPKLPITEWFVYEPYNFRFRTIHELHPINNNLHEFKLKSQDSQIVESARLLGDNVWTTNGPYGGGRFGDLEIDPNNPNIIFALNGVIGLYKSIDAGVNWSVVNSIENVITYPYIKVPYDIEIIPSQSNTIYALCNGLYRSTDSGENWEKMGIDQWGQDMVIHPFDSQVVFVSFYDNIYRTTNGGETWQGLDDRLKNIYTILIDSTNSDIMYAGGYQGLWKSTDGGDSWIQLTTGLPDTSFIMDIRIDPLDSNLIYTGLHNLKGIYKSTDSGSNWNILGLEGYSIWEIAINPHNNQQIITGTDKGVFLTFDKGSTWDQVTNGLPTASLVSIEYDQNISDLIYGGSLGEGLFTSVDGGLNWSEAPVNSRNGISSIAFSLSDSNVIYTTTRGSGVFKSANKGQTWTPKNNGLTNLYAWQILVHPQNSQKLYCPRWNEIYTSDDGGESWYSFNTNISLRWLAISPLNPNVLYGGETGLHRSEDGGQSWETIGFEDKYIFNPIIFHPYSSDTFYVPVGSEGIYRTTNGGIDWQEINSGIPTSTIRDVSIFPKNPDIIYLSTYQNGVYRSNNAGNSWQYAGLAGNDVLKIVVSPENPDMVLAGCFNYGGISEGVYLSLNGGESWLGMRNGLGSTEIQELIFDPVNPRHIFAGTYRHGIWEYTFPDIEHDIFVHTIILPGKTISPVNVFKPVLEMSNLGNIIASNFNVVCTCEKIDNAIYNQIYQSTQSIDSIASYESIEVTFDDFSPQGEGNYQFTFFHSLTTDQNHSNDTLSLQTRTAQFVRATNYTDVADARGGFGAAVGDYDLDGYLDIYHSKSEENQLLHNQHDGTFNDMAYDEGVFNNDRNSKSAGWLDYDNDGDQDLIVLDYEGITFFRNDLGSFVDVTSEAGFGNEVDVLGLGIGDYNNDSYLDIYATKYNQSNFFYSNNGDGTFSDITGETNLGESGSNSASAHFWDYDLDGDQDLLVVNHTQNTHLFQNNGDSTFVEVAEQVGIHHGGNAHHALIFDYNNDGLLDLYLINSQPHAQANILYRNDNGVFANVTEESGAGDSGDGTGGAYGDFDNNGYVDFYVVNQDGSNKLYYNNGDGTFTDISHEEGVDDSNNGRGTVVADFDNDGNLDIYLVNRGQSNALFYNTGTNNNWLHIKLVGKLSNRDAMGAIIKIISNNKHFMRMVDGNPGYGSQSSLIAEFGLGKATVVDSIIIYWPSGIVQDTSNVAVNQLLTIFEDISIVSIEDHLFSSTAIPDNYKLEQSCPNPFNPSTKIKFALPKPENVKIEVYNTLGQKIETLLNKHITAGYHEVEFNGQNLSSGVYLYRIEAGEFHDVKKMVLLR